MNLRSFSTTRILPLLLSTLALIPATRADDPAPVERPKKPGIGIGIVVRTTESVTKGEIGRAHV